jgi:hypothetical protein
MPGRQRQPGGVGRARSHCRFALLLIHFIADSLRQSVPVYLKCPCDRALGAGHLRSGGRRGAGHVRALRLGLRRRGQRLLAGVA